MKVKTKIKAGDGEDYAACFSVLERQEQLLDAHPEISEGDECDGTCEDCEAGVTTLGNAPKVRSN